MCKADNRNCKYKHEATACIARVGTSVEEQFAAFVEQVDKSKVVVQKALDEAQTLFDSLMQEYFG